MFYATTISTAKKIGTAGLLALLTACGGGGSGGTPTAIAPSSQFAQQCVATTGSEQAERQWARAYVNEAYLWYDEVPNINPVGYADTKINYFKALTTKALPAKDRFSFTYPTDLWNQLSQSGVQAGYGVEWAFISNTVPRVLRVAYVEPNSAAAQPAVNLQRGAQVLAINGVDINTTTQSGRDKLNAGLSPSIGVTTSFTVRDTAASLPRTVNITAANIVKTPVPTVLAGTVSGVKFGYILFNDHIATAERPLIDAVTQLKAEGVQELVLDVRYNGGGYLYIASQLAYMLASPTVNGRTFEKLRYNTKRVAENNEAPFPFLSTASISGSNGLPVSFNGAPLPQLGLSKVYVLTTGDTCSASEAIMNALRPFMNVVQIGGTTCGKPFGFSAQDNCGTSYFPIEFEGVNDQGQSGYTNGFVPNNQLVGCTASDDFDYQLGDANERLLSVAITHRLTGSCPVVAVRPETARASGKVLVRDPVRENKFLDRFTAGSR